MLCSFLLHADQVRTPRLPTITNWAFPSLTDSATEDWGIIAVDCMLFINFYYQYNTFYNMYINRCASCSLHDGLTDWLTDCSLTRRLCVSAWLPISYVYFLTCDWLPILCCFFWVIQGFITLCPSICKHLSRHYTAGVKCTFWRYQPLPLLRKVV